MKMRMELEAWIWAIAPAGIVCLMSMCGACARNVQPHPVSLYLSPPSRSAAGGDSVRTMPSVCRSLGLDRCRDSSLSTLSGAGIRILMLDDGLPDREIFGDRFQSFDSLRGSAQSDPTSMHATCVGWMLAGRYLGQISGLEEGGIAPGAVVIADVADGDFPFRIRYAVRRFGAQLSQNSYSRSPIVNGGMEVQRDFYADFGRTGMSIPIRRIDGARSAKDIARIFVDFFGVYDGYCADIDRIAIDDGATIFLSPGNWGNSREARCCERTAGGYGTVVPFGTAKNGITVAPLLDDTTSAPFAPFGPTMGGRMVPHVTAPGYTIRLPLRERFGDDGAGPAICSGASFSVPCGTGVAALMIERYRAVTNGSRMPSALLKAIILNSAVDIGPPGPDYRTGFGRIDAGAAIREIDARAYALGSVGAGETTGTSLFVGHLKRLSVMLAYNDPPPRTTNPALEPGGRGNPQLLDPPLVNDLDVMLVSPDGKVVYPLTLDPRRPAALARPGRNRHDNVEQCVVDAPAAGRWRIIVRGTRIGAGSRQPFALAWSGEGAAASPPRVQGVEFAPCPEIHGDVGPERTWFYWTDPRTTAATWQLSPTAPCPVAPTASTSTRRGGPPARTWWLPWSTANAAPSRFCSPGDGK